MYFSNLRKFRCASKGTNIRCTSVTLETLGVQVREQTSVVASKSRLIASQKGRGRRENTI